MREAELGRLAERQVLACCLRDMFEDLLPGTERDTVDGIRWGIGGLFFTTTPVI